MSSQSHLYRRFAALPVLFLLIGGCTVAAPSNLPSNPATENYDASLNVNIATMTKLSGPLYYKDSIVGTGAVVTATSSITVKYTGWLVTGAEFDSSPSLTDPLTGLISGWQEGLPGMHVGGIRKLVIGSDLGYGAAGAGSIPPNATLVFNIQLMSVQ